MQTVVKKLHTLWSDDRYTLIISPVTGCLLGIGKTRLAGTDCPTLCLASLYS